MSQRESESGKSRGLPKPIVRKMRWPFPLIWLIPLGALVAVGAYFFNARQARGPEIVITFKDVSGLRAGESPLTHLGVTIGTVEYSELSQDKTHARVHARLRISQDAFSREGAIFWIVRPEISEGSISGLNTVFSGPYIDCVPGNGEGASEFTGLDKPPVKLGNGLRIILHSEHLDHMQPDSPVYYRGIEVGEVQTIRLSPDARHVDVQLFITLRYAPLVRQNSRFWVLAGADVKGGLFSGVQLKLESLRSLLSGGIAFASPDKPLGVPANDGADFSLDDEAPKDAAKWSPHIEIAPEDSGNDKKGTDLQQGQQALQSAMKGK